VPSHIKRPDYADKGERVDELERIAKDGERGWVERAAAKAQEVVAIVGGGLADARRVSESTADCFLSSSFPLPFPPSTFRKTAVDGSSESEQRSTERVGKILNEEEIEGMRIVCRVRLRRLLSSFLLLSDLLIPLPKHSTNHG
jgi:hypothetical protein